jgi:sarcosine oxidase subunit gamma
VSALDGVLKAHLPEGAALEAGLKVRERRGLALVHLQAAPGAGLSERLAGPLGGPLPGVNKASGGGGRTVLGLAPDGWLVVDAETPAEVLAGELREIVGPEAAVVDMSHARCVLRIDGAAAREALDRLCPFDLHPSAFGPGDCFQGGLAGYAVLVHALDERPSFDLYVARSYALSFWERLAEAVRPFGNRVEV